MFILKSIQSIFKKIKNVCKKVFTTISSHPVKTIFATSVAAYGIYHVFFKDKSKGNNSFFSNPKNKPNNKEPKKPENPLPKPTPQLNKDSIKDLSEIMFGVSEEQLTRLEKNEYLIHVLGLDKKENIGPVQNEDTFCSKFFWKEARKQLDLIKENISKGREIDLSSIDEFLEKIKDDDGDYDYFCDFTSADDFNLDFSKEKGPSDKLKDMFYFTVDGQKSLLLSLNTATKIVFNINFYTEEADDSKKQHISEYNAFEKPIKEQEDTLQAKIFRKINKLINIDKKTLQLSVNSIANEKLIHNKQQINEETIRQIISAECLFADILTKFYPEAVENYLRNASQVDIDNLNKVLKEANALKRKSFAKCPYTRKDIISIKKIPNPVYNIMKKIIETKKLCINFNAKLNAKKSKPKV